MKSFLVCVMVLMGLVVLVAIRTPVVAHEGREVGDYIISVGWRVEPAYTGQLNGPAITITHHEEVEGMPQAETHHSNKAGEAHAEAADGIIGLEDTLELEVLFGPASRILNLRPVGDEPDSYTADLIPTRPGAYTFRLFGMIEDLETDETFSAGDGQFSSVEPIEDVQFP